MRFDGKVVLVTGAEQGIGRALARGFAERGAAVWANFPGDAAPAEALCADIRAAGGLARAVRADVRRADQVASMVRTVEDAAGRIDVLVNNAGVLSRARVVEMDESTWDEVLDVNLKGTFLCCRAVAPGMMRRGGGRIVNISSGGAWVPHAGAAHYSASKAGLLGFSRVFAVEVAPHGITVNCVAPGVTNTAQPRGGMTEEELVEAGRRNPLGRIAEPEDIVGPVLFFASEHAAYVTGQVLPVNGGTFMH